VVYMQFTPTCLTMHYFVLCCVTLMIFGSVGTHRSISHRSMLCYICQCLCHCLCKNPLCICSKTSLFSLCFKDDKLSQSLSLLTQHIFVNTNTSPTPKLITFVTCPFGLFHTMPSNKSPMATVKQSSPSKVPILMAGNISPAIMHQFEHGCKNYFIHKKTIMDDQVSLIIGSIIDSHVSDWISANHDCLITLSFDAFMTRAVHCNCIQLPYGGYPSHTALSPKLNSMVWVGLQPSYGYIQ